MLLLPAIMSGCRTKTEIVLPPMPERKELPEVQTIKDMAETILYYEFLVEEWELWGETVSDIIENQK